MSDKRIQLKVCGMRDAENMAQVFALNPNYMGFIFYRESPRFVGDDFRMPHDFPAHIRRVGVFVNEETDIILDKVEAHQLDYVQLHGSEPVEQCRTLADHGVRIIKVFSVGDSMDFTLTGPYKMVVDFFLFDTRGKYHGGNAMPFNWMLLNNYDQSVPFFLSGGLSPDNVAGIEKLSRMNLHAIDVNSGAEVAPALKDVNKIVAIKSILNAKTQTNEL